VNADEPIPGRVSVYFGLGSLAAYGCALGVLVAGYPHALETACPDNASAPAVFWPLILLSLVGAFASFKSRPKRRDERGERSGADVFALILIFLMPVAVVVTMFGYLIAYACWE
jgi:small-conductance mechanosensitive channel